MIDFQDDIEKHFRKNIIKSGMVEWGMATRIIPQAKDRSTALWWVMILWKMLWNISQEELLLLDYQKKNSRNSMSKF